MFDTQQTQQERTMNDEQARERRNDLTRYASRFWAGEAEIARTFFLQSRTPEEHLRWLRVQAYKELQPRPDGIILRNIDKLSDNYPALEQSVSRADFLYNIQFLEEEFRHYVVFADVIDYITGAHLTTAELATYDIEGERELRAVRRRCYDEHGELGRFASSFCEGGGASIFHEGMQIGGDTLSDMIAAACANVYADEVDHAAHGADDLNAVARTDADWALAREMVTVISMQRLRMRNEEFGFPLSDERLAEIAEGKIDLPARFEAMLV